MYHGTLELKNPMPNKGTGLVRIVTEAVSNARNRDLTRGREKGSLFCRHCLSLPTILSLQRGDQDEDFDVQHPWVCPASSRSTTTAKPANASKLNRTMSSPSVRFALVPPRRPEPRVTKVSRVPIDATETFEAPASGSGAAAAAWRVARRPGSLPSRMARRSSQVRGNHSG